MRKVISSQLLLYCNLRLPFRARGSSKLDSIMALLLGFFANSRALESKSSPASINLEMNAFYPSHVFGYFYSVAESLELVEHPPHVY